GYGILINFIGLPVYNGIVREFYWTFRLKGTSQMSVAEKLYHANQVLRTWILKITIQLAVKLHSPGLVIGSFRSNTDSINFPPTFYNGFQLFGIPLDDLTCMNIADD